MRFSKLFVGCLVIMAAFTGCSEINVGGPSQSACASNDDCSEGKTCQIGTCNGGACSYEILPDWCFVEGSCFQPGQELPGDRCQTCDPTLIQSGLVNKQCPEGQQCNSATGECAEPVEDTYVPDATASDVVEDTGPKDTQGDTESDASTDTVNTDVPAGVVPTCGQYCELYMSTCSEQSEFFDLGHCMSYCTTFGAIPPGSADDVQGNSLGCRIHALDAGNTPDFAGSLEKVCIVAGPSGGNECGTWCENYCHLAIKNCSGEEGYFESFNECKAACSQFPSDGEVGQKTGDTVQCRIYHLGSAGDPQSGGAELHCPHGSVEGTGGCEPDEEKDLCESYCQAFDEACPGEVIEGKAYDGMQDCLQQCAKLPQDGQPDFPMGNSVQCFAYHVSQAKGDQAKEHCINAIIGNSSYCVAGPPLRISEISPFHVNPLNGLPTSYVEILNQSNEPYFPQGELLIGTLSVDDNGENSGLVVSPIEGFGEGLDVLQPGQRIVVVAGGAPLGGELPVPPGTIVFSAELYLKTSAGLVTLLTPNGYFEVVNFGEKEAFWSEYFDSLSWDYPGKPAPAAQPEQAISRCPEDADTDDGSDFTLGEPSLGQPNNCKGKDDKGQALPGG